MRWFINGQENRFSQSPRQTDQAGRTASVQSLCLFPAELKQMKFWLVEPEAADSLPDHVCLLFLLSALLFSLYCPLTNQPVEADGRNVNKIEVK